MRLKAFVRAMLEGYAACATFGKLQSTLDAVREFANKSAASAASGDYVKFQAAIKSAASAASRKTKNQGPRSRGAPEPRRPQAEPSSVGRQIAADLITA